MRALIGVSDPTERRRIVSALTPHFEICEVATVAEITAQLARRPDVAVVDGSHARTIRGLAPQVYVVALVAAQPTPAQIWSAYAAGAHDVLRGNAFKEEVLGRALAPERLAGWSPQPAASLGQDGLGELAAWRSLDDIVGRELSALLGVGLSTARGERDIVAAAELPLVCSARELVLTLGIGVDRNGKRALQDLVLGGERGEEPFADALRELSNTAAGAVKRAALEDGVELTIGIPRSSNPFADRGGRSWLVTHGDVEIACIATVRPNAAVVVAGNGLREGMVLTRDIHNGNGAVLAKAGTYITRHMAERLGQLIGDVSVEVSRVPQAA